VAATLLGSVHCFIPISDEEYAVLSKITAAMLSLSNSRISFVECEPLFRSEIEPARAVVDGDLLSFLSDLPLPIQNEISQKCQMKLHEMLLAVEAVNQRMG
jgi:hypothetical protein